MNYIDFEVVPDVPTTTTTGSGAHCQIFRFDGKDSHIGKWNQLDTKNSQKIATERSIYLDMLRPNTVVRVGKHSVLGRQNVVDFSMRDVTAANATRHITEDKFLTSRLMTIEVFGDESTPTVRVDVGNPEVSQLWGRPVGAVRWDALPKHHHATAGDAYFVSYKNGAGEVVPLAAIRISVPTLVPMGTEEGLERFSTPYRDLILTGRGWKVPIVLGRANRGYESRSIPRTQWQNDLQVLDLLCMAAVSPVAFKQFFRTHLASSEADGKRLTENVLNSRYNEKARVDKLRTVLSTGTDQVGSNVRFNVAQPKTFAETRRELPKVRETEWATFFREKPALSFYSSFDDRTKEELTPIDAAEACVSGNDLDKRVRTIADELKRARVFTPTHIAEMKVYLELLRDFEQTSAADPLPAP